jgi:hypothetical protein
MFSAIKKMLTLSGETKIAQKGLTAEFAKANVDFMQLHPAIHGTLLRQYMMSGDMEEVITGFLDIGDEMEGNHVRIIDAYRVLREEIEPVFQNWIAQRF